MSEPRRWWNTQKAQGACLSREGGGNTEGTGRLSEPRRWWNTHQAEAVPQGPKVPHMDRDIRAGRCGRRKLRTPPPRVEQVAWQLWIKHNPR